MDVGWGTIPGAGEPAAAGPKPVVRTEWVAPAGLVLAEPGPAVPRAVAVPLGSPGRARVALAAVRRM